MDNDFMKYVYAWIEKALLDNTEYRELQDKCADTSGNDNMEEYERLSCEIESKAEELSYIQGFKDAMAMSRLGI